MTLAYMNSFGSPPDPIRKVLLFPPILGMEKLKNRELNSHLKESSKGLNGPVGIRCLA